MTRYMKFLRLDKYQSVKIIFLHLIISKYRSHLNTKIILLVNNLDITQPCSSLGHFRHPILCFPFCGSLGC